ncbi:hypothetical protein WMY93_018443 [Mugilogobius chulae]|uniref:Uncharacterized protein n=1 Tax=Mugilogobius chulae TaxID=88201 RepID=A0AAW0NW49_9GOBI
MAELNLDWPGNALGLVKSVCGQEGFRLLLHSTRDEAEETGRISSGPAAFDVCDVASCRGFSLSQQSLVLDETVMPGSESESGPDEGPEPQRRRVDPESDFRNPEEQLQEQRDTSNLTVIGPDRYLQQLARRRHKERET